MVKFSILMVRSTMAKFRISKNMAKDISFSVTEANISGNSAMDS